MSSITIRNLDDGVKEQLRIRAAMHGHSMEQEARVILKQGVNDSDGMKKGITGPELLALSRKLFGGKNGIDLELPPRRSDDAQRISDFTGPEYD